ncbi:MAG TPA: serine--tRNA ligase, partial [Erythrobacter sp.]|nr:serine--tRNA ligase [Erythrobacter sp.]
MHDIAYIRSNPQEFDAALARRGAEPVADRIIALDAQKREATTRVQQAQSRRNEASKAIGQAMGQGDKDKAEALKAEVAEIKASMPEWEDAERAAAAELDHLLATLPNLPAEDVPDGADESDNVEMAQWGEKRSFDFEPREHADIGPALGMDFETGTKLSGARFTFLRGDIARLHRALAQFMLDKQTRENGYTECNPPVLVGDEAMYGTDKLPKFAEDSFETDISLDPFEMINFKAAEFEDAKARGRLPSDANLSERATWHSLPDPATRRWLVPTSEVPLTYSVAGDILPDLAQPIRLTAHTLCFRSEAGSAGRDTRGFIRQHQF